MSGQARAPGNNIRLTPAHVLRHTPAGARSLGREAALVDIAQDLLLRELSEVGLMNDLVFKGGTALRKLYAGNAGRFSLDLDFSVREVGTQPTDVLNLLEEHVAGLTIGPFSYGIATRRGKRHLLMRSDALGAAEPLSSKLDVSSPPWLEPVERGWVLMAVHATYGRTLPPLPVIRLEENLAEKIARLNRVTPARDMYDLAWVANHHLRTGLDLDLIRRLAVLKVWVDSCGISSYGTTWPAAHSGVAFDPARWLRQRAAEEYDEEDIGVLAVPPPKFEALSATITSSDEFLGGLDPDERLLARAEQSDRSLALRLLQHLPGGRLAGISSTEPAEPAASRYGRTHSSAATTRPVARTSLRERAHRRSSAARTGRRRSGR